MHGKSARRSSLFLLELMISILMFSVTSAWCVRLFVTARAVVNETEELNRAQNLAAGYAELFLALEDFEAFLLREGAEKAADGSTYHICYDKDWKACGSGNEAYGAEIVLTPNGEFEENSIIFYRADKEEIYSLEVVRYTGGEDAL